MYTDDLPEFEPRNQKWVEMFVSSIVGSANVITLVHQAGGFYRLTFREGYFSLGADGLPSKSQWGTLKKRFKRRDPQVFIFRSYGSNAAERGTYYIDFGFMKY